MPSELIFIGGFILFIFLMMSIDLGLFGKRRGAGSDRVRHGLAFRQQERDRGGDEDL